MFNTKKGALKKVCAEVETFCGREPKADPVGIMPKVLPFLYSEKPVGPLKEHNSVNRMALLIAAREFGPKKVTGSKSNPVVVRYHYYGLKRGSDPVNWAANFVNYCIDNAGGCGSFSNNSIDFLNWGYSSKLDALPGDVVVFRDRCGFFVEAKDNLILVLGANDMTSVSAIYYNANDVIDFRRAENLTNEQFELLMSELPMIKKVIL